MVKRVATETNSVIPFGTSLGFFAALAQIVLLREFWGCAAQVNCLWGLCWGIGCSALERVPLREE